MEHFVMGVGYLTLIAWSAVGGLGFVIWAIDKLIRQAGLVLDFAYWYADRHKRKKKGRAA